MRMYSSEPLLSGGTHESTQSPCFGLKGNNFIVETLKSRRQSCAGDMEPSYLHELLEY